MIFREAIHGAALGQVTGDRHPTLARIGALEQIRREIAVLVVVERGEY